MFEVCKSISKRQNHDMEQIILMSTFLCHLEIALHSSGITSRVFLICPSMRKAFSDWLLHSLTLRSQKQVVVLVGRSYTPNTSAPGLLINMTKESWTQVEEKKNSLCFMFVGLRIIISELMSHVLRGFQSGWKRFVLGARGLEVP